MPSSSAAAVGLSVEAVFLLAIPLNQPFVAVEAVIGEPVSVGEFPVKRETTGKLF